VFLALALITAAASADDYPGDIKPLLKSRCGSCHGSLGQKGGLRLDTAEAIRRGGDSGPAVIPGDTRSSLLLGRVTARDASERMPPDGPALTAAQVGLLARWIRSGAKGPANEQPEPEPGKHWAFVPPTRPKVPDNGERNAVDAFLGESRGLNRLVSAGPAGKAELLRRAHLDLTGLPPTGEEFMSFMADTAPDAFDRVVERLLASPHHGERWGRHWMDVWRYSDWYGRRTVPDNLNSYGMIWRWRDWIVDSLNADKPYDRMVAEMLAGDELSPGEEQAAVATGFLVRNYFRWNYNQWMRDNVEHVSKAFLGITMNCAQCHDHKYDPISQEDYFRMRAIFEPLEIQQVRVKGEPDPGPYPKYSYPPGNNLKPMSSGLVRVFDEKPDALTRMYLRGDERAFVEGKPPLGPGLPAAMGGASFKVEPVRLPPEVAYPGLREFVGEEELAKCRTAIGAAEDSLRAEKEEGARDWRRAEVLACQAALEAVEARLAADKARMTEQSMLLGSKAFKAEKRAALANAEASLARARWSIGKAKAAAAAGDAKAKASIPALEKMIDPSAIEKARKDLAIGGTSHTPFSPSYPRVSSGRRLALAKAITARSNPLAARVAVNHVWNWHFGRPLVESVENFGRSGKPPEHPALLDWLAVELVESGWSLKHIHRVIMASSAYRMSSTHPSPAGNMIHDPDNTRLWKYPARRLEAEIVRDGMIAASGLLDRTRGGREIPSDQGMLNPRRSIYFSHHPEERMVFLELFDAANPCDGYKRSTSVMPQQALAMVNSPLAVRCSKAAAAHWKGLSDNECVAKAFRQILARDPEPDEVLAATRFLESQRRLFAMAPPDSREKEGLSGDPALRAREHLALALFNHGDFVTIR
jgi:mono/diheme cytochrome c family protein